MDIFEPIREILSQITKEEQPTQSLERSCGIKSSCYPPSEMYPDGLRVEYPFAISPKDTNRFTKLN